MVDYCDWLGEDDIQVKTRPFGFLAGNMVYYIGGSPSGPLGPTQPYETIGKKHALNKYEQGRNFTDFFGRARNIFFWSERGLPFFIGI